LLIMHTPSTLTPAVAEQIISDHAAAAHAHRVTRRIPSVRFARFRGRRSGASQPLVPRGRTVPPFAH
jgi:hypothetical protein